MFDSLLVIARYVVAFLIVFTPLVFIHELGHFMLAKYNGVYVYEFAIGMGKKVYEYQGKETKYTIRAIPIGGFVNMMGEDEESDDPNSFTSKSPFQRLSVLVAGPFMNFVLAFVMFVIFFASVGVPINKVSEIIEGYPAAIAGIEAGDEINIIDGVEINSWDEVTYNIASQGTEPFDIEVERNDKKLVFEMKTRLSDDGRMIIGIVPEQKKALNLVVKESFNYMSRIVKDIFSILGQLVMGKADGDNFVGPVGIINVVGQASQYGIMPLLHIGAVISINLGIFNLLPFPALDGGRIVFVLYEIIFRKPFDQEKERNLHYFGFIVLILLMVFLVTRDILNFG